MNAVSNPIFHNAEKAREWLEARIWPDGPHCPHYGTFNQATLMQGKTHRPGLYQCNACCEPFTVTVGTLYERSHIALHKWLAATHLLRASKNRPDERSDLVAAVDRALQGASKTSA